MRESIGSAMLLNIVIVIIGVISAFLISSIAYSKAFKAKNRIISVIEEYNGACDFSDFQDGCANKIEAVLSNMGYSSNISKECERAANDGDDNSNIIDVLRVYSGEGGHKYCVYKYTLCDYTRVNGNRKCSDKSNIQTYYKVITFMHFDIPVIGQFLEFPVSGETKTFYETLVNVSN